MMSNMEIEISKYVFHDMYTTRQVLGYKVLYQDKSYDDWTTVGKIRKYFRKIEDVFSYEVMTNYSL